MKKIALFITAIGLALGVNAMAQSVEHEAQAILKGTDGKPVGTVWFAQTEEGVKITAEITGLAPGAHAFHIHGTGKCEAPSFKSAGGHYNPGNKQHGFLNSRGPHAGDMPNIVVGETEQYEWVTSLVSLYETGLEKQQIAGSGRGRGYPSADSAQLVGRSRQLDAEMLPESQRDKRRTIDTLPARAADLIRHGAPLPIMGKQFVDDRIPARLVSARTRMVIDPCLLAT